jgi:hypothetical protein
MSPMSSHIACLTVLTCLILNTTPVDGLEAAEKIDFNRDIRPILSDNCFTCHGPDEQQRVSDLRLDVRDEAFASRDGGRAVVPGDPGASLLLQRVTASAPEMLMPPKESGRQLTDAQVQLLTSLGPKRSNLVGSLVVCSTHTSRAAADSVEELESQCYRRFCACSTGAGGPEACR